MSPWFWYVLSIVWGIALIQRYSEQMSAGLAVGIGVYAALWFLVGNAQARR